MSFLVVGCVRNVALTLVRSLSVLTSALQNSGDVMFFLVESDSSDDTVAMLNDIKSITPKFDFYSFGCLSDRFPLRTERLAYCRNYYLRKFLNGDFGCSIDYLVVADFDGVLDLLDESGISSCWSRDDWAVCCANQRGPYYDIWALRHCLWSPVDCWTQVKFMQKFNKNTEYLVNSFVRSKMIVVSEDNDWISVDSAFGGLALYKTSYLTDEIFYSGLSSFGDEVCEHVSLSRGIKNNGGSILINPRLINASYVDHSSYLVNTVDSNRL